MAWPGSITLGETFVCAPVFCVVVSLAAVFVSGAISEERIARRVLVGSATVGLGLLLVGGGVLALRLVCCALFGVAWAVSGVTTQALVPAAARAARWSLNRVNGWMEMGAAVGIGVGLALPEWPWVVAWLGPIGRLFERIPRDWLPGDWFAVLDLTTLQLLGLAAAILISLPGPGSAFWASGGEYQAVSEGQLAVWLGARPARGYRLALATVLAFLLGGVGWCLRYALSQRDQDNGPFAPVNLVLLTLGSAVGCWLAGRQSHPRRALSLVPLGLTGMFAGLLWMYFAPSSWVWAVLGLTAGWVLVPLRTGYQCALPGEAQACGMAMLVSTAALLTLLVVLCLFPVAGASLLATQVILITLAGIGALLAWCLLLREFLEQLTEILLWPLYRIRAHGPGLHQFPLCGPVLVLANHAAYLDPFWLAKHVPRRVIPMMTSRFFDKPLIHWLMTRIVHAIRVQETAYRREAPELQEAIAALDRGECVFLFPEGGVRRKDEVLLRPFGQGVWRILEARPHTPVVVCWIEGNWGSFFSHAGGPPMRGKRLDWWRRIDVVFTEPHVLPPDLLADQRATRAHLWRACLDARRVLGLPVPEAPPPEEKTAE
jgi:1-acyl-sn-glycerol-3-phosphate acyltransferase